MKKAPSDEEHKDEPPKRRPWRLNWCSTVEVLHVPERLPPLTPPRPLRVQPTSPVRFEPMTPPQLLRATSFLEQLETPVDLFPKEALVPLEEPRAAQPLIPVHTRRAQSAALATCSKTSWRHLNHAFSDSWEPEDRDSVRMTNSLEIAQFWAQRGDAAPPRDAILQADQRWEPADEPPTR